MIGDDGDDDGGDDGGDDDGDGDAFFYYRDVWGIPALVKVPGECFFDDR